MTHNNVVITMAGRSSRFRAVGYKIPKYEIVARGRSMFDWAMQSLTNIITPDSNIILICLAENHSADYVRSQCQTLGLGSVQILELDKVTDGQATTAFMSRDLWLPEAPLLIYNIDTYVNPRSMRADQIRPGSDGWIPCFRAPGSQWSFVKLGEDGWASDVAEKQRISEHASVGLYWFARAGHFSEAYRDFFADPANQACGERYVAPLYRNLIRNGCRVSISDIPVANVTALGTPEDLDKFINT